MSFTFLIFVGIAIALLLLLGWALRGPSNLTKSKADPEDIDRRHITYFSQVQQAMTEGDYAFLAAKGSKGLAQRVRKERRRIVLVYLDCLRRDFQKLLQLARVIAVLSPRVGAAQEFERVRLSATFSVRYEMIRVKLLLGFTPLPEMGSLSQVVSRLTIRLEAAMKELGERAALATELASSLDRTGLGAA